MKLLAIDCATEACSVALFDGEALLAGDCRIMGRGHAEALVPMIAALPDKGRADRIAVSLGPGSFTGIRVGIAAARALGLAWQIPVLGYPTLDLIAAMARAQIGARPVTVATTGGHGEWFIAEYDPQGCPLGDPCSLSPSTAAAMALADCVAGSQSEALVALRGHGSAVALLPDARAVLTMDRQALRGDLTPIYGRPPDARLPGQAA